jgi:hypothetical protein
MSTVPSAIAPHLLHSPVDSPPVVNLHTLMDPYRDNQQDSPRPLDYPRPPTPEEHKFQQPPEPQPQVPQSVASPSGMLVVHSYGPASAPPGEPLTAQVDFTNYTGFDVRLRVVFGDLALPTSVSPNKGREPGHERGDWELTISVPPVGQASSHMAEMGPDGRLEWPLTLQALDVHGNLLDTIGFGLFAYDSESVLVLVGLSSTRIFPFPVSSNIIQYCILSAYFSFPSTSWRALTQTLRLAFAFSPCIVCVVY